MLIPEEVQVHLYCGITEKRIQLLSLTLEKNQYVAHSLQSYLVKP